jgi:hypothetical protein
VAGTCGYGEGLSGSINAGNFLTSCKVYWLASQEGLCSMELDELRALKCLYTCVKHNMLKKSEVFIALYCRKANVIHGGKKFR